MSTAHVVTRRSRSWAELLLDPASGLTMFSTVMIVVYGAAPLVAYAAILPSDTFLRLVQIVCVGVVSMWVGARIPVLDSRFQAKALRLQINWRILVGVTFAVFILFVIVTFSTAPSIPILSALHGADASILSEQRGEFLKGRQGPALALLYVSTLLVGALLPYCAVLLYAARSRFRHWFAGAFLLVSISFLQKALFLNLVLPLLAYFARARRLSGTKAAAAVMSSSLLLLVGVAISVATLPGVESAAPGADVMSAQFAARSPLEYFLWRVFAVPIFTATDTLVVHAEYFDGRALLGATSTALSFVFGIDRINLERYVFAYQFGGWNDTANANAVFLVDGFVNFSWVGVVAFGLIAGQVFRWFRLSKDVAFAALWPLFAISLFSASLIGLMLSNGFLLMVIIALFVRTAPAHRVFPGEVWRGDPSGVGVQ